MKSLCFGFWVMFVIIVFFFFYFYSWVFEDIGFYCYFGKFISCLLFVNNGVLLRRRRRRKRRSKVMRLF